MKGIEITMEIDFLKNFNKRMEKIGAYALLFRNSIQKGTWKQYFFPEFYEQTNLTFAVLLFIMEQSLKEVACTIDDIGGFIDTLNMEWFHKDLSYKQCAALGDFIINVVLCDEGRAMYFKGFHFEDGEYKNISISFVGNQIIYLDGDVKRTSYYLTEDGYNLMLSTLEFEGNMMLTIHEMIFKLHLEKASYTQAVDDIKNIFNHLRIQLQKIHESMGKIRQNALLYTIEDYKKILVENLDTITDTKKKFTGYREHVRDRVKELEEKDINIKKLEAEEFENLKNLRIIEDYLNRAIDEHQKILSSHFDLKSLYTKELEALSSMSLIKRFSLRDELYDKILSDVSILERTDHFLNPLFRRNIDKIYNLNKSLELQKPLRAKAPDEELHLLEIEDEHWQEKQKQLWEQRKLYYLNCLKTIFLAGIQQKQIYLQELVNILKPEEKKILVPSVEIFKEVMVELLKAREIDISLLKAEQKEHIADNTMAFQLNICCLEVINSNVALKYVQKISAFRSESPKTVVFENVESETGMIKKVLCSDVLFTFC